MTIRIADNPNTEGTGQEKGKQIPEDLGDLGGWVTDEKHCFMEQMLASVRARSQREESQLSRATAQLSEPQWVEGESLTLSACAERQCRREFYM